MGMKKGITMADGPEWREVRAWFVRSLREVGFGRAEMSANIHEELQDILDSVQHGGVFSMQALLSPAIINVIWTLTTGRRMPNDAKLQEFIEMMETRTKAFDMAGGILSLFPWLRYIAPEASGYNLLLRVNEEIKARLMETIEDHKKKYVPGGTGGDLINIFLEKMYSEKRERSIYDEDQLFVILLDVLVAGSTTTTATLDFLFLRMTVHQDVQRRLHGEQATSHSTTVSLAWDRLTDATTSAERVRASFGGTEGMPLLPREPVMPRVPLHNTHLQFVFINEMF